MTTLIGIFVSPDKGLLMQPVELVMAFAGLGLQGDRYYAQKGSWKNKNETEHKKKRNVTLISANNIDAANATMKSGELFTIEDTRRNLLISLINPLNLIGKEFAIGHAHFLGIEHAAPCKRPSKLCGKPGFEEAFNKRGGLNAAVLKSGAIKIGDQLDIFSTWF